jgi:hypothetical protein
VEATYPGGNEGDPLAVPGAYHEIESEPPVTSFTLEVEGELFALRPNKHGGTHYTWLSGPNKDYGFSSSSTSNESLEEHGRASAPSLLRLTPPPAISRTTETRGFIHMNALEGMDIGTMDGRSARSCLGL